VRLIGWLDGYDEGAITTALREGLANAYVIAIMNMILHGIEAPNIVHTNTLTENLADIQEKDRYDVVLANPPFGGNERKEVQQNFPTRRTII
jgi:type I restriction enzyme M protein